MLQQWDHAGFGWKQREVRWGLLWCVGSVFYVPQISTVRTEQSTVCVYFSTECQSRGRSSSFPGATFLVLWGCSFICQSNWSKLALPPNYILLPLPFFRQHECAVGRQDEEAEIQRGFFPLPYELHDVADCCGSGKGARAGDDRSTAEQVPGLVDHETIPSLTVPDWKSLFMLTVLPAFQVVNSNDKQIIGVTERGRKQQSLVLWWRSSPVDVKLLDFAKTPFFYGPKETKIQVQSSSCHTQFW